MWRIEKEKRVKEEKKRTTKIKKEEEGEREKEYGQCWKRRRLQSKRAVKGGKSKWKSFLAKNTNPVLLDGVVNQRENLATERGEKREESESGEECQPSSTSSPSFSSFFLLRSSSLRKSGKVSQTIWAIFLIIFHIIFLIIFLITVLIIFIIISIILSWHMRPAKDPEHNDEPDCGAWRVCTL